MSAATDTIEEFASKEYKYGFVSEIESDTIPVGLSEEVIRTISAKKNEPDWLLEFRLKAYKHWLTMSDPLWHNVAVKPVDYQKIAYFSAPKPKKVLNSLPWTPSLTAFPLRPRLRESWRVRGSSSARSPKRSPITRSLCGSISARSSRTRTTSLRL